MPRPKPPEPLKPRAVRMNDTEWEMFKHLGGADWLRSRLDKLRITGIVKRQRNNRILKAHSEGDNITDLAKKFNVSTATIRRTLK